MLLLNAGAVSSPSEATVSFESSVMSGTDTATPTFSLASGSAASRKLVVHVMFNNGGSAQTMTSVTIDGNTMTEIIFDDDGINFGHSGFYFYDDSSSVSGTVDIDCVFSALSNRNGASLYSVFDAAAGTAAATDQDIANTHDLQLSTADGSVCIAGGYIAGVLGSVWSGDLGTEDYDDRVEANHSGASAAFAVAETVDATCTGASGICHMVSFSPA